LKDQLQIVYEQLRTRERGQEKKAVTLILGQAPPQRAAAGVEQGEVKGVDGKSPPDEEHWRKGNALRKEAGTALGKDLEGRNRKKNRLAWL